MAKLTREEKIEIYEKKKSGYSCTSLSKEYGIRENNIRYMISLIDYHGKEILRKDKNHYYSCEIKDEMINMVLLENKSINSTAIKYGLSSAGILVNWIKSYKENGYTIVDKRRRRKSTMKESKKPIDPHDKDAIIKQQNEEIEYLKAENEYLKKLRAVVLARKKRQSKKNQ